MAALHRPWGVHKPHYCCASSHLLDFSGWLSVSWSRCRTRINNSFELLGGFVSCSASVETWHGCRPAHRTFQSPHGRSAAQWPSRRRGRQGSHSFFFGSCPILLIASPLTTPGPIPLTRVMEPRREDCYRHYKCSWRGRAACKYLPVKADHALYCAAIPFYGSDTTASGPLQREEKEKIRLRGFGWIGKSTHTAKHMRQHRKVLVDLVARTKG